MTIQVSVVVPTYNRPDLLGCCLDALLEQDFDPARYEIIVADDAACEETCWKVEQLARRHRGRPLIRYVPVCHNNGPASARNAGWQAARGQIIAFTDDDCVPDPCWLAAGVATFQGAVAGVSGRLIMPIPENPTDFQLDAAHLEAADFVTANCFYRRDVLAAMDGFDERFETAWREDCDLYFRIIETGHTLVKCEHAVVVHPVREAAWGVSLSQQRKSMFNALLYKKHPQLYRERVQAAPPLRYYASLTALISVVGGILIGRGRVSAIGALVWVTLTGRFCAQRLTHASRAPGHVAEMLVTSATIPPLAVFWRLRGAVKFRVWFL